MTSGAVVVVDDDVLVVAPPAVVVVVAGGAVVVVGGAVVGVGATVVLVTAVLVTLDDVVVLVDVVVPVVVVVAIEVVGEPRGSGGSTVIVTGRRHAPSEAGRTPPRLDAWPVVAVAVATTASAHAAPTSRRRIDIGPGRPSGVSRGW